MSFFHLQTYPYRAPSHTPAHQALQRVWGRIRTSVTQALAKARRSFQNCKGKGKKSRFAIYFLILHLFSPVFFKRDSQRETQRWKTLEFCFPPPLLVSSMARAPHHPAQPPVAQVDFRGQPGTRLLFTRFLGQMRSTRQECAPALESL